MKKVVLSSAIALVTVFAMSSCKKNQCHECHYDKNGGIVEMGEFCGDALEDLEAVGTFTDSTGMYTVHCDEH